MGRNRLEQVTPELLSEAASRYGVAGDDLRLVGGFQNVVYEFDRQGRTFFLRLTHESRRSPGLIRSELDWVGFLAEHDVPVARPIRSIRGDLVEEIGEFSLAVFAEAEGRRPGHVEGLRTLGRTVGRMHALARCYQPPAGIPRRNPWYENAYLGDLKRCIPPAETRVHATIDRTLRRIEALPTDEASYGLIHGDLFPGNYRINDRGVFTLFDFDESQYGWFANDLGILLFYTAAFPDETTREDLACFRDQFLGGYLEEHPLDPFWLKQLPLFARLRQMILYAVIHERIRIDPERQLHPWQEATFQHARHTLEEDLPPVDWPL